MHAIDREVFSPADDLDIERRDLASLLDTGSEIGRMLPWDVADLLPIEPHGECVLVTLVSSLPEQLDISVTTARGILDDSLAALAAFATLLVLKT